MTEERAGHLLAAAVAGLTPSSRTIRLPEVRVMHGKDPPIHDRFLIVDDHVWLLGSSFNEFGARGSMMVRIGGSDRLLEDLEAIWQSSEPLANWIARHPMSTP